MNQIMFELGDATKVEFAMAVSERPQQRLQHFGVSALSDTELLALALQGNGLRPEQALDVAARLLAKAGSVASLLAWTPGDYRRLPGISAPKAAQLAATVELARRIMLGSIPQQPVLNRPELIAAHLAPIAAGLEVEKFWVLCLNRKNRLLKRVELTSGTATSALAHPRDVFRAALRENAVAIICAHNHPSGDPAPSTADVQVTKAIREAARTIEVDFLDHVIVGRANADPTGIGFYSFRQAGLL